MKFRPHTALRLSLAAGLAITAFALTGRAADYKTKPAMKVDIYHAALKVEFDHKAVSLHKKAAVAHRAHKAYDASGKKEVASDSMLTLPNRKKVKAGEYLEAINKIEKELNNHGHSLHDGEKKITLARTDLNVADLDRKAKSIAARHLKFDATKMKAHITRAEMQTGFKAVLDKDKVRIDAIKKHLAPSPVSPRAAATGVTADYNWHWELGRRNVVAAYLDANLRQKATRDAVTLSADAEAGAYLVNNKVSLLKATGSVTAVNKGNRARVSVTVAGQTVYNKTLPVTSNYSKSDVVSKTIDRSTTFRYMLGPIPMSVKLGAQGTVGVRYFVGVRPMAVSAQFVPFASTRAYVQAGIDIVVASAGVGGQLRLLDLELRLGGELTVRVDSTGKPILEEHLYTWSKISMLSGSLYLYADITVPRIGIPPWKNKHLQWDLWTWKGFSKEGYLVNVRKTQKL